MHTFEEWLEKYGQPYTDAQVAGGGTPWFSSDDERRELWERRYTRPAPPAGLFNNLQDIR